MGGSAARRRVTVIDDDDEFLELMRELLATKHEVSTFSGARISLHEIATSRPHLLMVDLHLSSDELSGWEIISLVRAHRSLGAVPLIICSASTRELRERSDAISQLGNTAVVAKPFTLDELENAVERGLNGGFERGRIATAGSRLRAEEAEAVLLTDASGRLLDATPIALDMLGLTLEALRDCSVVELIASDPSAIDAEWQRFLRERSWHGTVRLAAPEGGTRRVIASARVVEAGDRRMYVSWLHPVDELAPTG